MVYSAHYDGFGRDADGAIRPGAADNALGVAKLIGLAEAFAAQPSRPRRTIIFLAPTGEEYGNLGTEYWLDHPTWPLAEVAVNINFDGIGTDVFGPVKRVTDYGITYSDAADVVQAVLDGRGIALAPDGAPEQGFFRRSDHFSFTKRGVPPVYLIGGAGTDVLGMQTTATRRGAPNARSNARSGIHTYLSCEPPPLPMRPCTPMTSNRRPASRMA